MQKIYSIKEIAKLKGAQIRTVYGWTKNPEKHGIWKVGRNEFVLHDPDAHPIKIETPEDVISFNEWRARKMKEDALIAQREREVLENELCNREEVVLQFGQVFHAAKTKMLTVPTTIAGIVAQETNAATCKEIIEGAIREALIELGGSIARLGVSEGINDAPAEDHG